MAWHNFEASFKFVTIVTNFEVGRKKYLKPISPTALEFVTIVTNLRGKATVCRKRLLQTSLMAANIL